MKDTFVLTVHNISLYTDLFGGVGSEKIQKAVEACSALTVKGRRRPINGHGRALLPLQILSPLKPLKSW